MVMSGQDNGSNNIHKNECYSSLILLGMELGSKKLMSEAPLIIKNVTYFFVIGSAGLQTYRTYVITIPTTTFAANILPTSN